MTGQSRINASCKRSGAGIVLLATATALPLGGWLLLHVDWQGAAEWLRVFLVFYGTWMMDP